MGTVPIIIIILFVISGIFFYLPKVLHFYHVMTDKMRLDKKSNLSEEQQRKILIGAPYAYQQGAVLNTLKTKTDLGRRTTILQDYWGIIYKNDAKKALDHLVEYGHRHLFPTIMALYKAESNEQRSEIIEQMSSSDCPDDKEIAIEMYNNIVESLPTMKKINLISGIEDLERIGIAGWDAGRLSFIARLCYEARLLTEQEVWAYLNEADRIAHESFKSWHDLYYSYALGRFAWAGTGDNLSEIYVDLVNKLLQKEESPAQKVAF